MGHRINPRNIQGTAADGSVIYATGPAKLKPEIRGDLVHYNGFMIGSLDSAPDRGQWMIEQPSEMGASVKWCTGKRKQ